MTYVGIAFSREHGGRRNEYGIWKTEHGDLFTRYQGYRKGDVQVGVPLGGPHAAHLQPLTAFKREHYESVTFFNTPKEP